jgi:hypothetical protein
MNNKAMVDGLESCTSADYLNTCVERVFSTQHLERRTPLCSALTHVLGDALELHSLTGVK